ncbi:S-formylglutathione hydrolase [Durusdinium trenchii]|uniref:S-formylglutathione hydrolase n=2 Tax=Durusdinium trenchii TaxID=1381693 RepID=A0ABP0KEL9_9DINO
MTCDVVSCVMSSEMVAARIAALLCASTVLVAQACTNGTPQWDEGAFTGSLIGGSVGGIVVGILVVVLASLPLCCGVLKQFGKWIGAAGIILGLLAIIIPAFGSMGACGPWVDELCSASCTGCTSSQRSDISALCNAVGFIIVYLGAWGWAAIVLGIVGDEFGYDESREFDLGVISPARTDRCSGLMLASRFESMKWVKDTTDEGWSSEMVAARIAALLCASTVLVAQACTNGAPQWDQGAFTGSLLGGSLGGIGVAILVVVLASLPLCCGVLKQFGKWIGAAGIILGLLAIIIPAFGSMGACGPWVDELCSASCTGCTSSERSDISALCNALGFIIVYLGAYGWAAIVLGIVGASLSCCVCCGCCKAKMDQSQVTTTQVVVIGKDQAAVVPAPA